MLTEGTWDQALGTLQKGHVASGWKHYGMDMEYPSSPSPDVDRHTPVKAVTGVIQPLCEKNTKKA